MATAEYMKARQFFPDLALLKRRSLELGEFAALLEILPNAAVLVEVKQGEIILANAKTTELTAYTRQEISQHNLFSLFPELNQQLVTKMLMNGYGSWDLMIRKRDGSLLSVQAAFNALGQSAQWAVVTLEEASSVQQKEIEQELANQRWNALHILSLAPQGPTLEANMKQALQAGQLLTGASLICVFQAKGNEPLLQRVACWGHQTDLPESLTLSEVSQLREPYIWMPGKRTLASVHRNALAQKYKYMASVPIDQTNPLDGLIVVADQISQAPNDILTYLQIIAGTISTAIEFDILHQDYLKTQERPSASQLIESPVTDLVNDCIIYLAPDLTISNMNASAENTLGYASEEVSGEQIENVLIGTKSLAPALKSAQAGVATDNMGDFRLHRRDGSTISIQMRVTPVEDNGQVRQIIILFSDVSKHEEFRLRTQQLEQQALLGEVTAIFAHEVRNPINNISTGLQLMAMNIPAEDPRHGQIERMQQDCDRLEHLMKSVLTFSGPREYKLEAVDLEQLIQRLLDRWHPRMNRNNIKHRLQAAPNTPKVLGDYRALEQVFTNLLSNAITAMKERGGVLAVVLSLTQDAGNRDMVEINVMDNGPGIPEEIREKIFQPFFTTSKGGTGLGLAITQRIINAHKGTISVNSIPGGTIFHIRLPVCEEMEPITTEGESA